MRVTPRQPWTPECLCQLRCPTVSMQSPPLQVAEAPLGLLEVALPLHRPQPPRQHRQLPEVTCAGSAVAVAVPLVGHAVLQLRRGQLLPCPCWREATSVGAYTSTTKCCEPARNCEKCQPHMPYHRCRCCCCCHRLHITASYGCICGLAFLGAIHGSTQHRQRLHGGHNAAIHNLHRQPIGALQAKQSNAVTTARRALALVGTRHTYLTHGKVAKDGMLHHATLEVDIVLV